MLDTTLAELIGRIHASGHKAVIEFAGAGSLGVAWLHAVAGSSRTMLEATDRYSPPSMEALLGEQPAQFVARETAQAMAERAYQRAMILSNGDPSSFGVGCTATIATDRIKRGEHGCWVSIRSQDTLHIYGLIIAKGQRDRLGEETLVSRLLIKALAQISGVGDLDLALQEDEQLDQYTEAAQDPIAQTLAGTARWVVVAPDGNADREPPIRGGIFSGSFNPLHAGHELLAQAASVAIAAPVTYEIPIINADKPPLGYAEVQRRVSQFRHRSPVILSRAPRFVDKATLYPGCVFILGYDTAIRLLDQRYYAGEAGLAQALTQIKEQQCRFLIAGRIRDGIFHTLADLKIPEAFQSIFIELPEHLFRSDLSSTAVRKYR